MQKQWVAKELHLTKVLGVIPSRFRTAVKCKRKKKQKSTRHIQRLNRRPVCGSRLPKWLTAVEQQTGKGDTDRHLWRRSPANLRPRVDGRVPPPTAPTPEPLSPQKRKMPTVSQKFAYDVENAAYLRIHSHLGDFSVSCWSQSRPGLQRLGEYFHRSLASTGRYSETYNRLQSVRAT